MVTVFYFKSMNYVTRRFASHVWGQCKSKDIAQFQINAKQAISMLANEFQFADDQKVYNKLKQNFLKEIIKEKKANENGFPIEESLAFLQNNVFKNSTRFFQKGFLAWFPCNSSYTALMAAFINNSFTNLETTSSMRLINSELENKLLDWVKIKTGLTSDFDPVFICAGAGLSTILSGLAARKRMLQTHPGKGHLFKYYASEIGHYSQRKTANICGGKVELIKVRFCNKINNYIIDTEHFAQVLQKDVAEGKVPTFISVNIGTTSSTSIDDIEDIYNVCKKYGVWIHVDAAYSGAAALLKEYDWIMKNTDKTDSIVINLAKLVQTLQHSGAFYAKSNNLKYFKIDPKDLDHTKDSPSLISLEHTTSRFSKGVRIYGFLASEGFSKTKSVISHLFSIRKVVEETLKKDDRFEVLFSPSNFGLVCFKLKNKNNDDLNKFLSKVLETLNIMIGPYNIKLSDRELLILRISINSPYLMIEEAEAITKQIISIYDIVFNTDQ